MVIAFKEIAFKDGNECIDKPGTTSTLIAEMLNFVIENEGKAAVFLCNVHQHKYCIKLLARFCKHKKRKIERLDESKFLVADKHMIFLMPCATVSVKPEALLGMGTDAKIFVDHAAWFFPEAGSVRAKMEQIIETVNLNVDKSLEVPGGSSNDAV